MEEQEINRREIKRIIIHLEDDIRYTADFGLLIGFITKSSKLFFSGHVVGIIPFPQVFKDISLEAFLDKFKEFVDELLSVLITGFEIVGLCVFNDELADNELIQMMSEFVSSNIIICQNREEFVVHKSLKDFVEIRFERREELFLKIMKFTTFIELNIDFRLEDFLSRVRFVHNNKRIIDEKENITIKDFFEDGKEEMINETMIQTYSDQTDYYGSFSIKNGLRVKDSCFQVTIYLHELSSTKCFSSYLKEGIRRRFETKRKLTQRTVSFGNDILGIKDVSPFWICEDSRSFKKRISRCKDVLGFPHVTVQNNEVIVRNFKKSLRRQAKEIFEKHFHSWITFFISSIFGFFLAIFRKIFGR